MINSKHLLFITSLAISSYTFSEPKSTSYPPAFKNNGQTNVVNKVRKSAKAKTKFSPLTAFTGKVLGKSVRLRTEANIESHVVADLAKGDMIIVVGEAEDFYACQAPNGLKAHIFRIFVLDGVVEGKRVNVRLKPDLNSPIIGHMHTGDKIEKSVVSENNRKWLEIDPPKDSVFYVAKEFIENIGNKHVKTVYDKKKSEVVELFNQAELYSKSELNKFFEEIDFQRALAGYEAIVNDYNEFESYVTQSKERIASLKQDYLQKKLVYLETKTSKVNQANAYKPAPEHTYSGQDKMKHYQPIETTLFQKWSQGKQDVSIKDFYESERLKSTVVSGIVEQYNDPIKKKPGNYLIRNRELPTAYLYSTLINLDQFIGKQVDILVIERPNNNFAFKAYFALGVE